jgi:hypothetical protein
MGAPNALIILATLCLPNLPLQLLPEGEGQANGDGARQQQDRSGPDYRAHSKSGRLPPQRRSWRRARRDSASTRRRRWAGAAARGIYGWRAVRDETKHTDRSDEVEFWAMKARIRPLR